MISEVLVAEGGTKLRTASFQRFMLLTNTDASSSERMNEVYTQSAGARSYVLNPYEVGTILFPL